MATGMNCMHLRLGCVLIATVLSLGAQEQNPPASTASDTKIADVKQSASPADDFLIPSGTKVPLSMINSISTKTAAEGERIYLETVFPILANGRIVIPPGSYVAGTVTSVKRPGRVKGRGELYVRVGSLTLPNGGRRDFRAQVRSPRGKARGTAPGALDKSEGNVKSDGNKAGDVKTIGEAAGAGAGIGGLAGAAAGYPRMGGGVGGG